MPPRQVNTLTPAFSAGDHHHDHPPSVWAAETGSRAGTYRAAPSRGLTPPETSPPTGMRCWESWASQQGVRTALTTDSSKSQRHTKPCPAPSAGNPSLPVPQFPRRPAGAPAGARVGAAERFPGRQQLRQPAAPAGPGAPAGRRAFVSLCCPKAATAAAAGSPGDGRCSGTRGFRPRRGTGRAAFPPGRVFQAPSQGRIKAPYIRLFARKYSGERGGEN